MFGVDSVGVDWICSVAGACNHCGWSVEWLAKVDVLLTEVKTNKQDTKFSLSCYHSFMQPFN